MNLTRVANWTVDLAARLGLPQGDCYVRGYAFLPWWIIYSLTFGVVVLGIWALVRNRLGTFRVWGAGRLSTWRDFLALAAFCSCVVAAFDGSGFIHGFFRQDDFSFLQVVRETDGLLQQMRLYHSDHFCPLYRLEVWALIKLAGANAGPDALAICFNAINFITCSSLLLSGCWTLHELGGSRLALYAFAFLTWTWQGWGEFTAGYYTVSLFVQVQCLGFCATAAMLRGFRHNSIAWLAGSLILVVAAISVNISGANVFVSVFLFGAMWRYLDHLPRRLPYLLVLLVVFVALLGFYSLVLRHPYSARELVQNPSGQSAGPSMIFNLFHHPLGVMCTSVAALGGLLLNFFSPTFLQIVADRVGTAPLLYGGLVLAELFVGALAVRFASRRLSRLTGGDRWSILAAAGCALVCLGMVIVARTTYALHIPTALWHTKYIVMPACWLCVAFALFADRLWLSASLPCPRSSVGLLTALAFGIWLNLSNWQWERTLIPDVLAYTARGRWGNVVNAQERARHYHAVMADLVAIAHFTGSATVRLPEPSIWGSEFYRLHSVLEWGSDQTPSGVTYLFWDLLAASPGLHLKGCWVSDTELTPELRKYLKRYPWLQPYRLAVSIPVPPAEARSAEGAALTLVGN